MKTYSFREDIAIECGVNSAIIYANIQHWINQNKIEKRNQLKGHTWTYTTLDQYEELYPFLSKKQIRLALRKLIDANYIVAEQGIENVWERTTYYRLGREATKVKKALNKPKEEPEYLGETVVTAIVKPMGKKVIKKVAKKESGAIGTLWDKNSRKELKVYYSKTGSPYIYEGEDQYRYLEKEEVANVKMYE